MVEQYMNINIVISIAFFTSYRDKMFKNVYCVDEFYGIYYEFTIISFFMLIE